MKLTPEKALEKARQTYTEGVEYKSVFEPDSDYTDKVAESDIYEYSVLNFNNGFRIMSAQGKGVLYNSHTDEWAEIIVQPNTLEYLKQQEAELLKQLSDNRDKQRKIKSAEIEKKFGIGIGVGDVIEYEGKKGIVSRIDADRTFPVYYLPFKANGKPAMREVWCYGLEKINLIEKKVKV